MSARAKSATPDAQEHVARVLVVDDEFSVRDSLTHWFRKDGHEVETAENASEALKLLQQAHFDVALVDIKMPGMDGIELQRRMHDIDARLAVVMITAFASVETAIRALKQGAFDYVTKPIDPDELSHLVARAIEARRLKEENVQLRERVGSLIQPEPIIGESPPMKRVMQLVEQVAPGDSTVLILGASGTGKELIARAIHANSARSYFPIVPVNCGALPDELLESELFGHEKGAFTGAQQRRKGRIEMADGGTLFLDEVGAIHPRTQVDLLRVLETKEFTRVGGSRPVRVDFRVICATNEDLMKAVKEGRFREDFFYRINVFSIEAPALKDRMSDLPILVSHFVEKFSREMDKRITGVSEEAMELLMAYDWPGNVRELSNAIERAMVVGQPPVIRAEDLPLRPVTTLESPINRSLADVERHHIRDVLDREGWNITRAAEVLQVDRVTVYNKIKKYGLEQATNR